MRGRGKRGVGNVGGEERVREEEGKGRMKRERDKRGVGIVGGEKRVREEEGKDRRGKVGRMKRGRGVGNVGRDG